MNAHPQPIPALWPPDSAALDLNFAARGELGPLVTFTRASSATYINASGLVATAATNAPRFTHDPVTLVPLGLLVEEARTNLVFPSAVLTTQTRTVAAVPHTLSFAGTGTVTLSGASTAGPLVGTGSGRVSLTFTPSAGSLTLTVTGSVTDAQLEAGAFASSYIPTTAAAATRAADVASITGAAFASWFSSAAGSFVLDMIVRGNGGPAPYCIAAQADDGTNANRHLILRSSDGTTGADRPRVVVAAGGGTQADIYGAPTHPAGARGIYAYGYALNDFAAYFNGVQIGADAAGSTPAGLHTLRLGRDAGTATGVFTIARLRYWRRRLPNAALVSLSA